MSASEQNYANGRQTATISVGNEGVKDASGFSVDVYEDDDWIDTVDVNESIASGEEKEIEITFSKSVSKEVQTYRFVINQDEDRNTKNNEQEIKLGYADVSLKTNVNNIDLFAGCHSEKSRVNQIFILTRDFRIDALMIRFV